MLKSASSAAETRYNGKISLVASFDGMLYNKRNDEGADQTAHMPRLVCTFVDLNPVKTDFLTTEEKIQSSTTPDQGYYMGN